MRDLDTGLHYPIDIKTLPDNWVVAFIEDYAELVESGFACGKHNSKGEGIIHLRPMNVSRDGAIDLSDFRSVPNDFNEKRLSEGDVLFNNTNSPELIGKTARVTKKYAGLAFSNHMTRIKFHREISSAFAAVQLHYLWMMKYYLHRCVKHVNQASISTRDMARTVPLVLPPLNEQKRIVAKIEELFSELDNGIAALKTAREQLKVYRQAVLKHAFEGKLTAKWREENADKLESPEQLLARIQQERETRYQQQLDEWKAAVKAWEANGKEGKKPGKPRKQRLEVIGNSDLDDLFDIPEQWKWVFLNELSEHIVDGTHHTPNYTDSGVPFISAKDIKDFKIDFGDTRFIDAQQHKELVKRCRPRKNSVLLTKSGTIGRVALVNTELDFSLFESVANIPLLGDLQGRFVMWAVYFQVSSYFGAKNQKGVAVRHLHLEDIRRLPIPLPSYNEQIAFIERIENIFDRISKNEAAIDTELLRSETLRQSILKKAFSGQLVPQDPNDEPASELLARIQAEKAAGKATQKASAKPKTAAKPGAKRSRKPRVFS